MRSAGSMNRFTGRLLLVDSAILVSVFAVFSLLLLGTSLLDIQYFGPFELYFIALFLAMYLLDKAGLDSLRVETYIFLLLAGLSGFDLIRIHQFDYFIHYGLYVIPSLFLLIKGLTFLVSSCLFCLFRFREVKSGLTEKGEWEGSFLYQNLLFWVAVAFVLGLFIGPLFAPTHGIIFFIM